MAPIPKTTKNMIFPPSPTTPRLVATDILRGRLRGSMYAKLLSSIFCREDTAYATTFFTGLLHCTAESCP